MTTSRYKALEPMRASERIAKRVRLRLVRADSGFCVPEWLDLLEEKGLRYIVMARLLKPVQRHLRKDTIWCETRSQGN